MRRRFVVGPLVLFSGSCVTGPYTPSMNFLARAEEVPIARSTVLPSYTGAYACWQLPPQNPWARYNKLTLLASLEDAVTVGLLPDVRELTVVQRAEQAAAQVAGAGLPADTLWMVDLRGAAAVAFGNVLSQLSPDPVSLVLTFNNWPAQEELIPAEETLSALISMRPKLPDPYQLGTRPVFLLDSWRLAYRETQPDDEVFDNRYVLNAADLPDPQALQAQGIHHVVYVVEGLGEDAVEEDDLHESFMNYQQAGITIHMVDLADLAQAQLQGQGPVVLQEWFLRRRYYVRYRTTLLMDPGFYTRARGGFGGMHARPAHLGFGTGFTGPSHGGG